MTEVKIFVAFRSAPKRLYTLTFAQAGSFILMSDIERAVCESPWMGTMRADSYRIEYMLHNSDGPDTPVSGPYVPAYSTLYLRRLPNQKPAPVIEATPTPISYSERFTTSTSVKT